MIPHVTQCEDADVTDLEAFRVAINNEQKDVKLTMLALIIKASVAALKKFPAVNSSLDGEELVLKQYYNIGFAADTPNGLVVPVVKDADKKGVFDIARDMTDLSKKARDGKLGMGDMTGATFTISSLGGIGGTYFTPIINAPEVAILGASRTSMKPIWDGKAFKPRADLAALVLVRSPGDRRRASGPLRHLPLGRARRHAPLTSVNSPQANSSRLGPRDDRSGVFPRAQSAYETNVRFH